MNETGNVDRTSFLLPEGHFGKSSAKPTTDEDEITSSIEAYKQYPTRSNSSRMLKVLNPAIEQAAKSHVGSMTPHMMASAKQLALKTIGNFDPSKSSLNTYLYHQMRGLKRIGSQKSRVITIPERVAIESNSLNQQAKAFEVENGYEPSDQELADFTGISVKRIGQVRSRHHGLSEGLFIDEEGGRYSPEVENSGDDIRKAWMELVYSDLDNTNKRIMELTGLYGNHRPLSNTEIAARLGITPSAVSQRKAKIQEIINREDLNPFS